MIYDHISQIDRYTAIHPNFAKAAAFLRTVDHKHLPVGFHDTGDEDLTFEIKQYSTTPETAGQLVAHRRFGEVWIQLCSCEIGKFAFTDRCQTITAYQPEQDLLICKSSCHRMLPLAEDDLIVLMPSDAHSHELLFPGAVVKKAIIRFRL